MTWMTGYVPANLQALEEAIRVLAAERHLVVTDTWMTKVLQLYQIQKIHHGVMMVGNSGSGKSAAWRLLLDALQKVEAIEGVSHVIDSKVMSKEALYGSLDSTTREWTDGLFTSILRKEVANHQWLMIHIKVKGFSALCCFQKSPWRMPSSVRGSLTSGSRLWTYRTSIRQY
ncbi:hypothetical protein HIM_11924 [Hirsutella minnesotensis 3608]|uniref:Dynein heavy chain hydrolytic ATP-binding dynein motor region domain-containing protein n=1 Tax=Hirsutella minnesotensis 3608 TaxID=1043627 RepID=A0A0F7ZF81_9HYPO|nr:hypothetical protein HIM_11924 [Hirsutella minnesotensis 3608]